MRNGARAAGLVLGVLADSAFGDPRRGHPVAAFGTVATALERRLYRDSILAGAAYVTLLTTGTITLAALTERAVHSAGASHPARAPRASRPTGARRVAGASRLASASRPAGAPGLAGASHRAGASRPAGASRLAGAPRPRERTRRTGCADPDGVRLRGGRARLGRPTSRRVVDAPRAWERTPYTGCERVDGVRPWRGGGRGGGWWPAVAEVAVVAVATWAVLGGTSLVREGVALGRSLSDGDLAAARARIPHLCARDPELLDAAGMARAGVESLAENTSDAVVAPLFWGAVAGVPGLLGYRAVNTLDAMVGYRSARYERFGRVAARLDDLVNLVPARLTAALTVLLAPAVGGSAVDALRAWRRDASGHPSPNAGPVEATAAGALGLRLGGRTEYAHGAEERPALGDGRAPDPSDLTRAAHLSRLLGAAATVMAVALALVPRPPGAGAR